MDFDTLFSSTPSKTTNRLMAQWVAENPASLDELWKLACSNEKRAWRAAWVIDHVHEIFPTLVFPYIPKMIEVAPQLTGNGQKRHILKVISLNPLPRELSGKFVDFCFSVLDSPAEAIAVRAHAMQILFNLAQQHPELKNELALIIEARMDEFSVGLKNKGRKILKRL